MDCDRRIGGSSTALLAPRCGLGTTSPRCCSNACARDPYADEITWGDAVRTADEAGFDDLLEVAFTRLSEHRPYEGWAFPGWLRAIVEGLERFPGKGWPLIREGLTSGVMMERRFGLNGVWAFGGKPWPREAVALVAALARSDPDEYNREKAAELLEDQGYPGRPSTP